LGTEIKDKCVEGRGHNFSPVVAQKKKQCSRGKKGKTEKHWGGQTMEGLPYGRKTKIEFPNMVWR